jgi:hypothetical protein
VTRRTEIQLALATIGLIVWGYGQRTHDRRLTFVGMVVLAAAALFRFFRKKKKPETTE